MISHIIWTVVAENIIKVTEKHLGGSDLMECSVEIDRRMLDFCAGFVECVIVCVCVCVCVCV